MLDEGVVAEAQDIDLCMILGAGWPFHLGGDHAVPGPDRHRRTGHRPALPAAGGRHTPRVTPGVAGPVVCRPRDPGRARRHAAAAPGRQIRALAAFRADFDRRPVERPEPVCPARERRPSSASRASSAARSSRSRASRSEGSRG